jgi:hypothetical protein
MSDSFDLDLAPTPAPKKRKLDTAAAAAVSSGGGGGESLPLSGQDTAAVLGPTLTASISTAFLSLVHENHRKVKGALRIASSGDAFVLTISQPLQPVTLRDLDYAISTCGVFVTDCIVNLAQSSIQVTFLRAPSRLAVSKRVRVSTAPSEDKSVHGASHLKVDAVNKLLTDKLVPCAEDRKMLTALINYWSDFRGQDTPADVHWVLHCLDDTIIQSKTGQAARDVDAKGDNNKDGVYTLFLFGVGDVAVQELREPESMLWSHVESISVSTYGEGFIAVRLRTYTKPLLPRYVFAPAVSVPTA